MNYPASERKYGNVPPNTIFMAVLHARHTVGIIHTGLEKSRNGNVTMYH